LHPFSQNKEGLSWLKPGKISGISEKLMERGGSVKPWNKDPFPSNLNNLAKMFLQFWKINSELNPGSWSQMVVKKNGKNWFGQV